MRRLVKPDLPPAARDKLKELANAVEGAEDPKQEMQRCWQSKHANTFDSIRVTLQAMASGRSRCMYCEDSFGTDIEHFWPKSDYPLRAFDWLNYLLACSHCNSNLKRTLFPLSAAGLPLLIDPTIDDPASHLSLMPSSGEYLPLTEKGRESIAVFGLNDGFPRQLPRERKGVLLGLTVLLQAYDQTFESNPQKALEIKERIFDYPFGAVLDWMVATSEKPNAERLLDADIVALIETHGVASWR